MENLTDIILISPKNRKLGIFSSFLFKSVPIGIGVLASYLIKFGFSPEIIDAEITVIDEKLIKQKLENMALPKIFGISCMTTNIQKAYQIAKLIKKSDKDAIVIAGGIHPTVESEEVITSGHFDFVVRAEGEKALLSLINKLKANDKDYSDIKNLVYIGNNGEIITNEIDEELIDVNELPSFPYHLFDSRLYDLGFTVSSRGCPFNCIFCSQRAITKGKYRWRKKEYVIEELDFLINQSNQKNIGFFDDCFTADKKRVFELCSLIKERKLHEKCTFGAQTRGDTVNKELLEEMKTAGFTVLMFGFETSSDHLMKIINKGETVEDNINAVKIAKELGYNVMATFIFGFPEETYEDRINALKIAKKIGIDIARFNIAIPFPGTELYRIAVEQNKLKKEDSWSNFNSVGVITSGLFEHYTIPYCPEGIKPVDLAAQVFLSNFLFYVNLKNLQELLNFKNKDNGKWFNIPKEKMLSPKIWFDFVVLFLTVAFKTIYFLTVSKEARKFFIEGFKA